MIGGFILIGGSRNRWSICANDSTTSAFCRFLENYLKKVLCFAMIRLANKSLFCSLTRMLYWGLIFRWKQINIKRSFFVRPWLQVILALMVDFLFLVVQQRRFSLLWLVKRILLKFSPLIFVARFLKQSFLLQDFTMQPPAQQIVAKDLHDNVWTFRHIYRGELIQYF